MAEPNIFAASAATAAGAATVPFLALLGLDLTYVGAGLVGVVITQTLLPTPGVSMGAVAAKAVGSVLLASLATPFSVAIVVSLGHAWLPVVPEWHVKAALAATVGGFAQIILLKIRAAVDRFGPKGAPDA
jgi:hypothetical protein